MFIPEKIIRHIWQYQRLRKPLLTTDNQQLVVLSIGTLNPNAGADFLNAKILINNKEIDGDVEIHSRTSDWHAHKHSTDTRYSNIILNVVFKHDAPLTNAPTLELRQFLNDDLHKVIAQCIKDEYQFRTSHKIPCHPLNLDIPFSERVSLLETLSMQRLSRKGNELLKNEPDFELALLKGTCVALGYSANTIPMTQLAERFFNLNLDFLRPLPFLQKRTASESILFHLSGLLNASILSSLSEKDQEHFASCENLLQTMSCKLPSPLSQDSWIFFRLRPFNFPTLHIAGFAEVFARHLQQSLFKQGLDYIQSLPLRRKAKALESLFITDTFGYWKTHFRFAEKTGNVPTLIGSARAGEIVINVLLPILYIYATNTQNQKLLASVIETYKNYPKQVASSLSLETIESYLGDEVTVKSGFVEQGILELRKNYCNSFACLQCKIGNVILSRKI